MERRDNMPKTKHELILKYIENLEIGAKVSVRQIAKDLSVSEGTAYRAIKQAENKGLVSSIPKVGTIRIEEIKKKKIEDLALQEIAMIVEGTIVSGESQLQRMPKAFIVGSTVEILTEKALDEQTLVIVSGLEQIQRLAVKKKAALLLTDGTLMNETLLAQARAYGTPVIQTPYDTFVAISMINKAIYERLVEQELVRLEDIMCKKIDCLHPQDTISDWHELTLKSGHSRFPVVNGSNELVGLVSPLDVTGQSGNIPISEVMSTEILTAAPGQLVSHLSRLLVWEECELVPVVDEKNILLGVVSRQDIIQALQQTQKQPQFGETVDNLTLSGFKLTDNSEGVAITGKITQFMVNEQGVASTGALTMIISNAATIAARKTLKWQTAIEDCLVTQINPLNVEQEVVCQVAFLKIDKRSCKIEVVMADQAAIYCKAILNLKWLKK